MSSGFFNAANASMVVLGVKRDSNDQPASAPVTWRHAWIAVFLLVVLQLAGMLWQFSGSLTSERQEMVPALVGAAVILVFIALLAAAIPFLALIGAAFLFNKRQNLPLLVMSVALMQILFFVLSVALSLFGFNSSSALIGVVAFYIGRIAWSVLGLSIRISVLVALLGTAATIAVPLLILLSFHRGVMGTP